jgi:hypothetical protein
VLAGEVEDGVEGERAEEERGEGGGNEPSIFLSTRSTAPEQPPQVMVTLNL